MRIVLKVGLDLCHALTLALLVLGLVTVGGKRAGAWTTCTLNVSTISDPPPPPPCGDSAQDPNGCNTDNQAKSCGSSCACGAGKGSGGVATCDCKGTGM